MKIGGIHYRTIWPDQDNRELVAVIDQRQLPHRFVVEHLATLSDAFAAIREMVVRGAGLIGATAGFGMYLASLEAGETTFRDDLDSAAKYLKSARPTARNLAWAADRVLLACRSCNSLAEVRHTAFGEACRIADEDAAFCEQIGRHGRVLLEQLWQRLGRRQLNILTHCNAGWLAFVDYGSATAPIYAARSAGIDLHVWVSETRPWNQGSRLTAWELQQEDVPNTLITDNAAGLLMQRGDVDLVLVGSDRTTRSGDVANKIGTYLKALAAADNKIPFYVALPSSTLDWQLDKGIDIPIEQRSGEEITTITGPTKGDIMETISLAADGTRASNYSFDITPARLVTALITERGVVKPEKAAIQAMFPEHGPAS